MASLPLGSGGIGDAMDLRQTMRKVANDPLLKAIVRIWKAEIILKRKEDDQGQG